MIYLSEKEASGGCIAFKIHCEMGIARVDPLACHPNLSTDVCDHCDGDISLDRGLCGVTPHHVSNHRADCSR